MIVYVAVSTAVMSLLVLALVYVADLWEREPLDLLQNAFLAGVATQLVLVLGVDRLAGIESWSGWLYLLTVASLAVVVPVLLAAAEEVDERFDGIVYAVAFTVGAAAVAHLFNLPQAAARHPELAVLGSGEAPRARDLLLLVASPGPRGLLGDLSALLLVAVLAGAVLGTLKLRGRPLLHQVAGTLGAAVLLGAADLALDGWWPARLALAAAALGAAVALKRRSVFRRRRQPPEREVFLGAVKTGLLILGAIVLALSLVMSLTDAWDPVAALGRTPPFQSGAHPR